MSETETPPHMKQKHKLQSSHNTQRTAIILFSVALVALLALGGFLALRATSSTSAPGIPAPIIDGVQEVRMAVNGYDYEPSVITITAGQKVRWIVDGTQAAGCAHSLVSPQIGVRQILKSGENIIEFTPTKRGTIPFTCSMGMTSGEFQVV